jgi:hypothetical protein
MGNSQSNTVVPETKSAFANGEYTRYTYEVDYGKEQDPEVLEWVEEAVSVPDVTPWSECVGCLINGQTGLTVVILAILVQEASRTAEEEAAEEDSDSDWIEIPHYRLIVFFSTLLLLFLLSIFRIFEKQARSIAFYAAFRKGVLIDFKTNTIMGLGAGYKNIGTVFLLVLAVFAGWTFYLAAEKSGLAVDYVTVALALLTVMVQLHALQASYRQMDCLEDNLISLPKFMESDPNMARKHLKNSSMQVEAFCMARISDIINKQRWEGYHASVAWAEANGYDRIKGRNDPKGMIKKIWNDRFAADFTPDPSGDGAGPRKKLTRAEKKAKVADFQTAIVNATTLFSWDQLGSDQAEKDEAGNEPGDYGGNVAFSKLSIDNKPNSLRLFTWSNTTASRQHIPNKWGSRIAKIFKGKYITMFERMKFQDQEMSKIQNKFIWAQRQAVFIFGMVFLFTFSQGFVNA